MTAPLPVCSSHDLGTTYLPTYLPTYIHTYVPTCICRARVLFRDHAEAPTRVRRRAGCVWRAWHWWYLGRHHHRPLRQPRGLVREREREKERERERERESVCVCVCVCVCCVVYACMCVCMLLFTSVYACIDRCMHQHGQLRMCPSLS